MTAKAGICWDQGNHTCQGGMSGKKGERGRRRRPRGNLEADMGLSEVLFAQGDAESHSTLTFLLPGLQALT